jgi:CHAT domain-containing protein
VEELGYTEVLEYQLPLLKQAYAARHGDEMTTPLIEGIVLFGHRFLRVAKELATTGGRWAEVYKEAEAVFLAFLMGTRLTNRADEDDRRADVCRQALDFEGLELWAAKGILALPEGHPSRDVGGAADAIKRYATRSRECTLLALPALVLYRLEPNDALLERVEWALSAIADYANGPIDSEVRYAAISFFLSRAAESRPKTAGFRDWTERAHTTLEPLLERPLSAQQSSVLALTIGLNLIRAGKRGDGLALLERASELAEASTEPASKRLRLEVALHRAIEYRRSRQFQACRKILEDILPTLKREYTAAVEPNDVEKLGGWVADAVETLALAHVRTRRWSDACRISDDVRSLRTRYRAELYRNAGAIRVRAAEAALHDFARTGITHQGPPSADSDWLRQQVAPRSRLFEQFRVARSDINTELPASPAPEEIAAVLDGNEAVVVLLVTEAATLAWIVLPTGIEKPLRDVIIPRWSRMRWEKAIEDWMLDLIAREHRPGVLENAISVLDEVLARKIVSVLPHSGIERVTIVTHRPLHLLPLWASPALSSYIVHTVSSSAQFVASRRGERSMFSGHALAVVNPTGDLSAGPAHYAVLAHSIGNRTKVNLLPHERATVTELWTGLPGASLLHFCGHGKAHVLEPDRSALLLSPGGHAVPLTHTELENSIRSADWQEVTPGTRYCDVPGTGRVYEELGYSGEVLERRLEHPDGTYLFRYAQGRLLDCAELWTAGEMMYRRSFDSCALAFVAACESGLNAFKLRGMDEDMGIPAALELAGVASVVTAAWPIHEKLALLFASLFYDGIGSSEGRIDVANLVHESRQRLRSMTSEEAAGRLAAVRQRTGDSTARFRLEAFEYELKSGPDRPFTTPLDWAAFFLTGAPKLAAAG